MGVLGPKDWSARGNRFPASHSRVELYAAAKSLRYQCYYWLLMCSRDIDVADLLAGMIYLDTYVMKLRNDLISNRYGLKPNSSEVCPYIPWGASSRVFIILAKSRSTTVTTGAMVRHDSPAVTLQPWRDNYR